MSHCALVLSKFKRDWTEWVEPLSWPAPPGSECIRELKELSPPSGSHKFCCSAAAHPTIGRAI